MAIDKLIAVFHFICIVENLVVDLTLHYVCVWCVCICLLFVSCAVRDRVQWVLVSGGTYTTATQSRGGSLCTKEKTRWGLYVCLFVCLFVY